MAKLSHAQEPSMEEILASIRRIISDEETTAKDGAKDGAKLAPALSVVADATRAPAVPTSSEAPTPRPAEPRPAHTEERTATADDEILELTEAEVAAPPAIPPGMERDMDIAFADTPARREPTPAFAAKAMIEPGAPSAEPAVVATSRPSFSYQPAADLPPREEVRAAEPAAPRARTPVQEVPMLTEPLLSERSDEAVNNAFNHLAHTMLSANARTLEDLVKDLMRPMLKTWLDDNLPPLVERLVREEIERVSRGGGRR